MPQKLRYDDYQRAETLLKADNRDNSQDRLVKLCNCRVVRFDNNNTRLCGDDQVWYLNGRIVNDERMFYDTRRPADVTIDCDGQIVAPGYIDVQMNGAKGIDFSSYANCDTTIEDDGLTRSCFDANMYKEGVRTVSRYMLSAGVTAYCPTLISCTPATYARVLPYLAADNGSSSQGAHNLGAHCEGPMLTVPGAHPLTNLCSSVSVKQLDAVYGSQWRGKNKAMSILTLAPEVEGAEIATAALTEEGVCVMLGHTQTKLEPAEACMRAGARGITHLWNAMKPYHHRSPSLVGLLASECVARTIYFGIIVDGLHVHASAVRIAYRTNRYGMVLVSDACAALGVGDGRHCIGGTEIDVCGPRATKTEDPNTLAGSVSSLPFCANQMRRMCNCSIAEAIETATLHPAQLLGIEKEHGSFVPGAHADINILDDEMNVLATYIGGQLAATEGTLHF